MEITITAVSGWLYQIISMASMPLSRGMLMSIKMISAYLGDCFHN